MNISTLNALIEALNSDYPLNKVMISSGKKDKKVDRVVSLCRDKGVRFQFVPQQTINRKAGPDNQGVFAEISPVRFYTLEEILNDIKSGLLLILDRVSDMGNLGALIRSAVGAGVDAIIISEKDTAPINETVLRTSAGSLLKARIVQSRNLNRDVEILKKHNFWIIGADKTGETVYYDYDFSYKTAVILGSEQKGIAPLLKKNTDYLVSIPHTGEIESLNVSAATAIILFEAIRQKNKKNSG